MLSPTGRRDPNENYELRILLYNEPLNSCQICTDKIKQTNIQKPVLFFVFPISRHVRVLASLEAKPSDPVNRHSRRLGLLIQYQINEAFDTKVRSFKFYSYLFYLLNKMWYGNTKICNKIWRTGEWPARALGPKSSHFPKKASSSSARTTE